MILDGKARVDASHVFGAEQDNPHVAAHLPHDDSVGLFCGYAVHLLVE
jgi:hypothetical protein